MAFQDCGLENPKISAERSGNQLILYAETDLVRRQVLTVTLSKDSSLPAIVSLSRSASDISISQPDDDHMAEISCKTYNCIFKYYPL